MPRWDDRLRKLVNDELQYLWAMGAEFEAQNPGVAPHLRLSNSEVQDPFVERLLDGFAFLTARVRMRMEDEFPRFTHSLLDAIHPNYLSPTPAMTIVQLTPKTAEGSLVEGYAVPRNTRLQSARSDGETSCTFLTRHDVTLWPVAVREAKYHSGVELGPLALPPGETVRAAIRIKLETRVSGLAFNKLSALDDLCFYLKSMPRTTVTLYEQLFAHAGPAWVRTVPGAAPAARASAPRRVGFDDRQAMLPDEVRNFQGYRLLCEYFAMPQRFLFFELTGLAAALRGCGQTQVELIIPFNREERQLENLVTAANFALYCTPAINLFPEVIRADISPGASEFPLIPRLNPLDYEVYRVDKVVAAGGGGRQNGGGRVVEQTFLPFYRRDDMGKDSEPNRFFTTRRLDNRFERAVSPTRGRDEFIADMTSAQRSGAPDAAARRAGIAGATSM